MNGVVEFSGNGEMVKAEMGRDPSGGPCRKGGCILDSGNVGLPLFLDAIDTGINVQDENHVILYENRFFRSLFDGAGRKCFEVYEHRDCPCEDCPVTDAIRTGRMQKSERQVTDHKGNRRLLALTATPYQGPGGLTLACTVVREICPPPLSDIQWKTSEESSFHLIENVNEGICIAQDGQIVYANRRVREWNGWTAEHAGNRSLAGMFHPTERDVLMERYHRRVRGEEIPDAGTFRILISGGRTRWVELRASRITWRGSTAVLYFLHDVTDLAQAERRLKVAKRISDAFLTVADDRIYGDILGILLEALESPCGLIGCLDAETVVVRAAAGGMPESRKVPSIPKEKWDSFWGVIVREGKAVIRNRGVPVPAGHVPIERTVCAPILDDGVPVGLIGLANRACDYQEEDRLLLESVAVEMAPILRARLEREKHEAAQAALRAALRQSEERYRGIFETAVEGIFQTTLDGRFVSANPALAKLLGAAAPGALLENRQLRITSFYVNLRHREEILSLLLNQGRDVRGFETQFRRLDGSTVWVSINARMNQSTKGKPVIDGTVEDISARKNLELQLLHSQKLDAIGTMAGGIAHDFNNILGIIIGYAEIIRNRKLPVNHKAHHDLEQVMQAALRARDLVKQILSFSRQEAQSQRMIEIRPLIKESARMLRATLPSTIRIQTSFQEAHELILGDPGQIYQVLINLCTNAAHAMRETMGTLKIALAAVSFPAGMPLPHPDLHPGSYLRLSVSDTGEGIDPAIRGRIFDPFFTTKAVHSGSGLGLSVVHGIVKAHHGAVTVESEPGKGSTFHIYLPVAQEGGARLEAAVQEPPLRGQGRILLVDDEQDLAEMTAESLTNAGYEVTALTSPLEALRWFGQHAGEVDLIITDQTMPAMTGLQMTEKLRMVRRDIPVVLCTGYSQAATQEAIDGLGIKLVMKPVLIRELVQAIKALLSPEGSHG